MLSLPVVHSLDPGNSTLTSLLQLQHDSTSNADGGLVWSDLAVHTQEGYPILHPFSGYLENGKICGIMGPSGSGKTTFLSAICGTQPLPVSGQVWAFRKGAGQEIDLSPVHPKHVAFLQQHDDFFDMLTVRETLDLAAFLELPHLHSELRQKMVQSHIDSLGLSTVSENRVGSYLGSASRLSGGERRRLSVALELLTEKQLFIADEPTSGLDSGMSATVMKLIKDLIVQKDIPCLCVLHQPRSSIWHNLDSVIVLGPGGRVCYSGPKDEALAFFASHGFPCPQYTNPAEFLVDLMTVNTENHTIAKDDLLRIERLAGFFRREQEKAFEKGGIAFGKQKSEDALSVAVQNEQAPRTESPRSLFFGVSRLFALLRRSWRQNIRNQTVNLVRLLAAAGNALLLAQIFPTVRGNEPAPNSIADRVALMSFGAINMCMIAYMKTIDLFSRERPVVRREQMRHQYSSLEYLVAKAVAELPLDAMFASLFTTVLKSCTGLRISWGALTSVFSLLTMAGASLGFLIGSNTKDGQVANTVGIPIVVILMVVGVINPSGVDPNHPPPLVVRLAKKISPFAYAIEALCIGEYPGMKFAKTNGLFKRLANLPRMGALSMVQNGDQVIEALGLQGKTFKSTMASLAILTFGNLMLSWLGLYLGQRPSKAREAEKPASSHTLSRPPTSARVVIRRVRM